MNETKDTENPVNNKISDPLIESRISENMKKQKFHSLTKKINKKFGNDDSIKEVNDIEQENNQVEETSNSKNDESLNVISP
jgi:hypothetical protein